VRSGIEDERRARSAVWSRCGRINKLVLTPTTPSSSGRLRIWSVTCTRVRGMFRVRMIERRVLWIRVSRWRSLGPGDVCQRCCVYIVQKGGRTSNSYRWSHIDFYESFFRYFVSSLDLNGAIYGADDGVAIVCIRRGAVGAV
jgi:hypothetical protein